MPLDENDSGDDRVMGRTLESVSFETSWETKAEGGCVGVQGGSEERGQGGGEAWRQAKPDRPPSFASRGRPQAFLSSASSPPLPVPRFFSSAPFFVR